MFLNKKNGAILCIVPHTITDVIKNNNFRATNMRGYKYNYIPALF